MIVFDKAFKVKKEGNDFILSLLVNEDTTIVKSLKKRDVERLYLDLENLLVKESTVIIENDDYEEDENDIYANIDDEDLD